MKKRIIVLICLGFLFSLTPFTSRAFEAIKVGDTSELTIYGFLRNDTGVFVQSQEYANNGNHLATERTLFRTYIDFKLNEQLKAGIVTQFSYEPWYPIEEDSNTKRTRTGGPVLKHGKEYSEYKDIDDILREAFITWEPNKKNSLKVGRQIVQWGEALTDRVGDVVHPNDSRSAFFFANLEDTRIPQWMARGIHDVSFLESSFEWIVNPLLVEKEYRVSRSPYIAQPLFSTTPEQKFALHPEDRPSAPTFIPIYPVIERFPSTWKNMRYGMRTTTNFPGITFGMQYFHTQIYEPLSKRERWTHLPFPPFFPGGEQSLVHPNYDIFGLYMNAQLPWPGVIRAETIFSPNKAFNTLDYRFGETSIVRRAYFKYMVAYDLNSFFYFQWHKTAPIDITLEHIGEWIPRAKNIENAFYNTEVNTYSAGINARISTNFFYNRLATDVIVGFNTFGSSGLFIPSITWKPGYWNNRFSAQLRYINIYGKSSYQGLGIFREKDMVVLTTQFNF